MSHIVNLTTFDVVSNTKTYNAINKKASIVSFFTPSLIKFLNKNFVQKNSYYTLNI